jgi:hypothetical protein
MNINDYLARLQTELKNLSPEEKSLIVEEISSHFDEGQADPVLGIDEISRLDRLENEMGDPQDLARRLKHIHHPNHWLEYLLIVIPEVILLPLLFGVISILFSSKGSMQTTQDSIYFISIRASIVIQLGLVLIGAFLYKRNGTLTGLLFWLSSVWLSIFSMCYREERWMFSGSYNQSIPGFAESIFWNLALIGLLIWLSKLLWKTKDPLWFTFVAIPFLTALGNLTTGQVLISGGFPGGYTIPNWRFGWLGFHQIAVVIWPALFIFPKQRLFRWFALLVNTTPYALMNLIASSRYPYLIAIWSLPIVLVVANWIFDSTLLKDKSPLIR